LAASRIDLAVVSPAVFVVSLGPPNGDLNDEETP